MNVPLIGGERTLYERVPAVPAQLKDQLFWLRIKNTMSMSVKNKSCECDGLCTFMIGMIKCDMRN